MKKIILILSVLMLVTSCASLQSKIPGRTQGKNPDLDVNVQRCLDVSPRRGLSVDFIQNAPPSTIKKDREFPVILKFANYNKDDIYADLTVQDTSGLLEPATTQVTIEGATYKDSNLIAPGCKILSDDKFEKKVGSFKFNADTNKRIMLLAKLNYAYTSLASGTICAFDPAIPQPGCSAEETLSGSSLGPSASFDPVTVTKIVKVLNEGESESNVMLNLDIYIKNMLKGTINTPKEQLINFRISSDELQFDCMSQTSPESKGTTFDVALDSDGETIVNCVSSLSLNSLERYTFIIEMQYLYEYYAESQTIDYQGLTKSR